ncbi:MAG: NAD(P)H-dependent oxidoreductase subunit E [Chitinispirillaceae bacterium]|nr:NAD(P)H-dependent oxidoreductase subunit E [Chitinispirillaceae bacterium]
MTDTQHEPYPGFGDTQRADVIVIDDEESMCEACRQTLEEEGHTAVIANNGHDGIEIIKRCRPAVVLLDLKMPGMSGIEVLRQIKTFDPRIAIIIVTGYGSIESAVESMKYGAFDFLAKPVDPEMLLKTVSRGIQRSGVSGKQSGARGKAAGEAVAQKSDAAERQDILLRGLEALGDYCALGEDDRNFYGELKYLEAEARYHTESLGQIKQKEKVIRETVHQFHAADDIIKKHDYRKSALIQILLDVQGELRWLPRHVLNWIAARLNVPVARLYALANFYEVLHLDPIGEHVIQICDGTACHVKGSSELMERISALLGIKPGETDAEQRFTLKSVHCLGCCALAPVVKIDDTYYSNPSMDELKQLFDRCKQKETPTCRK